MRIAQVLAGYTLAEADVLRKAVGKKDAELIQQELEHFVERAVAQGVDHRAAADIADQIVTFGRYGFNRSHSVAYALLSYQTAWLKRHYPAEFMAALLSSVVDKTDDVVKYIGECRELGRYLPSLPTGLQVLAPDLNESEWKFTPVSDRQIRFGLGAIRGLGEAAVQAILEARRAAGRFGSLFDLVDRVDARVVGKRALESLIQAGACDVFGHRAQLLAGLELAVREAQLRQAEAASGQSSLFDALTAAPGGAAARAAPQLPAVPRWSESERLAREKEILGFFISGHPLEKYREELRVFDAVNTSNLKACRDQRVELACVVTGVSRQLSKRNGAEWGRITVEDFYGSAAVLAFGEAWEQYRDVLEQDAAVLIRGTVSGRDEDAPPLFLESAVRLGTLCATGALGLEVLLGRTAASNGSAAEDDAVTAAARLFRAHPGGAPLFVSWRAAPAGEAEPGRPAVALRLRSRSLGVDPSEALLAELRALFGPEQVRLVKAG